MFPPPDFSIQSQRLPTVQPVWTPVTRINENWFDQGSASPICGDLCAEARRLSVEEHTHRILGFLIGDRAAP